MTVVKKIPKESVFEDDSITVLRQKWIHLRCSVLKLSCDWESKTGKGWGRNLPNVIKTICLIKHKWLILCQSPHRKSRAENIAYMEISYPHCWFPIILLLISTRGDQIVRRLREHNCYKKFSKATEIPIFTESTSRANPDEINDQ